MPVGCWNIAENKHVGANRMLGFQSGCQSEAGLADASLILQFNADASRMLDLNADASQMLDFSRK